MNLHTKNGDVFAGAAQGRAALTDLNRVRGGDETRVPSVSSVSSP